MRRVYDGCWVPNAECRTQNSAFPPQLKGKTTMSDSYVIAADHMNKLETELRSANLWPGEKPPGEIEVKGAFGGQNMAFEQWLAWILIPRVRQIIAERGAFPKNSSVAAYAVREMDTTPNADCVLRELSAFDRFIDSLGDG
jgi:uncharacterized protein YqcC (DUF446 family)